MNDHHFDDVNVVATDRAGEGPQNAMGRINAVLGLPFKLSKRKDTLLANKFKGVVTDFSQSRAECIVSVYVEESRIAKVIIRCKEALEGCTANMAAKVAGKCLFATCRSMGRLEERRSSRFTRERESSGPRGK